MDDKILITGATGRQGGTVARHLLKYGKKVRALTRHSQKAEELKMMGAEIIEGDLTDLASIERALEGIKKMFLVTTPYEAGIDAEIKQGVNGVDAASAAGVDHLVFTSVGSAHRHTGIPHFDSKWKIEQHIRDLGLTTTILRPAFFMENFGAPWLLAMLQKGMVSLPLRANRKLSMIAVENIGEYGAQAFIHPDKFIGEEIELASDDLTMPEAIGILSKAAGKEIAYRVIPLIDAEKLFGREATLMYKWFDEVGYNPNISELEPKYGVPLTRFGNYLSTATWLKMVKAPVQVT